MPIQRWWLLQSLKVFSCLSLSVSLSHTQTHICETPWEIPWWNTASTLFCLCDCLLSSHDTRGRGGLADTLLVFSAPAWVRRFICQLHHHHSVRATQERAEVMNQMCVPWERQTFNSLQLTDYLRGLSVVSCQKITGKMQYWFLSRKKNIFPFIGTDFLCMGFVKFYTVLKESGGGKWILPGWETEQCSLW